MVFRADTQKPTANQKKENIIKALRIAGFTENTEYPGMYSKTNDDIKTIVDLTAGVSSYLYDITNKIKITGDDDAETLGKLSQMIVDAENGKMPTKSKPDLVVDSVTDDTSKTGDTPQPESNELEVFDPPEADEPEVGESPIPARQHKPPVESVELTINIVKKYINEKVTDEEAYRFIQLCKARHLNPFLGQIHLIKKEFTGMAKTVVGKDAFMEQAVRHPQYDGFEAGIIIKVKGKTGTEDRPGAFYEDDEKLMGGWAKVYRKDQKYCTESRVSMKEYNSGQASWNKMPATMIRKVAIVQALREAFVTELSGMYDSSEVGVEIESEEL